MMKTRLLVFLLSALVVPVAVFADDTGLKFGDNVIRCAPSKAAYDDADKAKGAVAYPLDDIVIGVVDKGEVNTTLNSKAVKHCAGTVMFTVTKTNTTDKTGECAVGGTVKYDNNENIKYSHFYVGTPKSSQYSEAFNDHLTAETKEIVIPSRIYVPEDVSSSYAGYTFKVTSIGENAFEDMGSRTSSSSENISYCLPQTITVIDKAAFQIKMTVINSTYRQPNIKFYQTDDDYKPVFEDGSLKYGNEYNNINTIGDFAFNNLYITTAPIGSNTESLGVSAFNNCSNITSIVSSSITSIGERCFANCSSLNEVNLTNVSSLGANAFVYCVALTDDVSINGSMTEVPEQCFAECSGLKSVKLPSTVTTIGENAFKECKLEALPTDVSGNALSLQTIGNQAFVGNKIREVKINEAPLKSSLKTIGQGAFANNRISYLKLLPATNYATDFYIGELAFADQLSEFTVDLTACTDVPQYLLMKRHINDDDDYGIILSSDENTRFSINEKGYTDEGGNDRMTCLRVIVPIGCIEKYKRSDGPMQWINRYDYRVKFPWGLTTNYYSSDYKEENAKELKERKYYPYYNITPQQRLVATSAWKNDELCFRPTKYIDGKVEDGSHGETVRRKASSLERPEELKKKGWYSNTVDYWDEENNVVAEVLPEEPDFFDDTKFAFNKDNFKSTKNFNWETETNYPKSLMPYSLHTYHANIGLDEEHPQIGRRPIMDGLVPYDQGIVIDYPKPGYYLVPPALVPMGANYFYEYKVVNDTENKKLELELSSKRVRMVTDDDKNDAYVWMQEAKEEDGERKYKMIDLFEYFGGPEEPGETGETGEPGEPGEPGGSGGSGGSKPYSVIKETILDLLDQDELPDNVKIEWVDAETLVGYLPATSSPSQYGFEYIEDDIWWIDLFDIVNDDEAVKADFHKNQDSENDHNIAVPITDAVTLYPYWTASPYYFETGDEYGGTWSDRTDNDGNFKATTYGKMGDSSNEYVNIWEEGAKAKLDPSIKYVNFGFSKGYFAHINNTATSPANRAYFSIHRDHMDELFPDGAENSRIAIYMEDDMGEPDGISTIGDDTKKTANAATDAWYTIEGQRINGTPTTKGIYIRNGRKEVIR